MDAAWVEAIGVAVTAVAAVAALVVSWVARDKAKAAESAASAARDAADAAGRTADAALRQAEALERLAAQGDRPVVDWVIERGRPDKTYVLRNVGAGTATNVRLMDSNQDVCNWGVPESLRPAQGGTFAVWGDILAEKERPEWLTVYCNELPAGVDVAMPV